MEKIEQLGGMKSDFDINEFYLIFKQIKALNNVQDVWITITDIDEEWLYSDTALIAVSKDTSEEDVNKWFGKGFPSEIREVNLEKEKSIHIPYLKDDYKLLSLWWD
ncbi:hypothetical protein KQI86_08415 [Clostridium sp. MSJ-11]|uniref:Uncharacterized protein n=1 Tax=Clostridium mobile TaxID=2841512 RepID=A0ABS6EGL4_9CLOT|nr:hypothetical protein [Clostridium mobile]MBU5484350.1 hypothetical protein [Clostridium mobile]